MPIPGRAGRAFQPIWAEDVADCVMAALPAARREADGARYELAGPGDADLPGDRRARAALVRPPPPDRQRPGARRAAARCSLVELLIGPDRVRHLGRGRAARGADDLPRAAPPTPSGSGCCRSRCAPCSGLMRICPDSGQIARPSGAQATRRGPPRAGRLELGGEPGAACPRAPGGPISWTPVGSPSSPWYSGSEIAGWPVTLKIAVYGRERGRALGSAPTGRGRGRGSRRSAPGAAASAGVSTTS